MPDKVVGEVAIAKALELTKGELNTKADLVANGTEDNLTSLTSTGNIQDSGVSLASIENLTDNYETITQETTDQIFNYRTTPAEQDGYGKITKIKGNSLVFNQKVWSEDYATIQSIKGNTVKFNQLIQNGNFADFSNWQIYTTGYGSYTTNNNKFRFTVSSSYSNEYRIGVQQQIANLVNGHKYFFKLKFNSNIDTGARMFIGNTVYYVNNPKVENVSVIFTLSNYGSGFMTIHPTKFLSVDDYYELSNICLFDLTAMGIDNLTTIEQVETWLSNNIGLLPYYDYTLGSLIPFTGTGLKTVGKNLFNSTNGELNYWYDAAGNKTIIGLPASSYICEKISVSSNNYTFKANGSNISFLYSKSFVFFDNNNNFVARLHSAGNGQFSINVPDNASYFVVQVYNNTNRDITSYINDWKIQVETGTQATLYEPYISNTLSLPISTYFPTGMKKAETVYDELTENKAITRLKKYTFTGNEVITIYGYVGTYYRVEITGQSITPDVKGLGGGGYAQAVSDFAPFLTDYSSDTLHFYYFNQTWRFYLPVSTNEEALEYLKGKTMYYELATPTSQEISLDLTYSVYQGGTEQILPVNSSTPTTTSMKATIDYPDGIEEAEFLYKQTLRNIVLTDGHSYITRIDGTWSNVSGTGQTLSVGDDDMVIDLTQMACSYITNYTQFLQYYPNDYDFEKGKLISFNGTSLKTGGKNRWFGGDVVGTTAYTGQQLFNSSMADIKVGDTVTISFKANGRTEIINFLPSVGQGYMTPSNDVYKHTFTLQSTGNLFYLPDAQGVAYNFTDVQIEFGSTATEYESYIESTLSLETLNTLFPTGMKSAGSAYDEATNKKAYTRISEVDLGTLNWEYVSSRFRATISDMSFNPPSGSTRDISGLLSSMYEPSTSLENMTMFKSESGGSRMIYIYNNSYSSASDFKTAMSGQYLFYELATPIEQDINL